MCKSALVGPSVIGAQISEKALAESEKQQRAGSKAI
jgi:hypothetical protein